MNLTREDLNVERIGECRIVNPMKDTSFVDDDDRVLYQSELKDVGTFVEACLEPPSFEMAGPRRLIYFDPSKLRCGIVTCGGLCPGLNDVIRAIVMSLFHHYGARTVYGFRYGFEGLSPRYRHEPIELTPRVVASIHEGGGTMLGSSRGPQDVTEMVDTLERMGIGILFAIGGDGTLRGAQAICREIALRNLKISVICIPKTIDNDISHVRSSFGFETAVTETRSALCAANTEALGARNGVGLVKLMGRESGFIAAFATLANSDVNFCLVPEAPFTLEGFLLALQQRLERRGHAVIVVAEGAGQDLMTRSEERDPSGNPRFQDIGLFLKEKILNHFRDMGVEITLKYIDPSYTIRSMPANPHDSVFCLLLGHNAVHAGMAGRTNMVVGNWNDRITHVPISLAVSRRKCLNPEGRLWGSVVESTGQPKCM